MLKQKLIKSVALTAAVTCMLLLVACGSDPAKENTEQNQSQTIVEKNDDQSGQTQSQTVDGTEKDPAGQTPSQNVDEKENDQSTPDFSLTDVEQNPPVTPPTPQNNVIAKINGGADEVGIYSIVVRLTDQAADKGVVEMVYYGAKGSPQENSIVNTFRIEYYREDAGTFEIQTFFNGEVYQNQHHKDEVKVVNTFDATLRAGNVIISYTPDGGETQEIFRADADYFCTPAN